MTPVSARRRLLLNLRKMVRPRRRFKVEYDGEDRERLTCTTCGYSYVQRVGGMKQPISDPAFAERLIRYRAQGGGVGGQCPKCTKQARDERYPLP